MTGLTLGAVDLLGTSHDLGWWIEATGEDADFGQPEQVERAVMSFLQDGAISTTESYDNREMTLRLRISATSSSQLAAAEAALVGEVGERNVLTWIPPGDGSPCVFDVVNSSLGHDFDDLSEVTSTVRYYTLTVKALPFARAQDLATPASMSPPPSTPTVATVDDGTVTTGWSAASLVGSTSSPLTVSTAGGAVKATSTNSSGASQASTVTLSRTGLAAAMSTTPYVRLDWAMTFAGTAPTSLGAAEVLVNGVKVDASATAPNGSGGSVSWHRAPALRTNLNPNPNMATTTGYSISADTSAATTTAQAFSGTTSLQLSRISAAGAIVAGRTGVPMTAGKIYTFSFYLRSATVTQSAQVRVDWKNASGTVLSTSFSTLATSSTTAWTRYVLTATAPTGATQADAYLQLPAAVPTGQVHYLDAFLIEQSEIANPYFDGASTAANGATYAWTGTANNSTSTETNPALSSVILRRTMTLPNGSSTTFSVQDISRSDASTDLLGARQVYRSLAVDGTARTQGNLRLEDPAAGLGSALVYTTPNTLVSAQPPLRPFLLAGPTATADANLVSGKSSDFASPHYFEIPASQVPAGNYLVMARVKSTGTSIALGWQVKTKMNGTVLDKTWPSGTRTVTVLANTWTVTPVATAVLPTQKAGSAGVVRIELTAPSGTLLDEAWLFNLDAGRLTWVECGSGAPVAGSISNRLWLDAASLTSPVASVTMGTAADRSDAYAAAASMQSFGDHQFVPPSMNVFTVTTNSVNTTVTLSYYPRYFGHVA